MSINGGHENSWKSFHKSNEVKLVQSVTICLTHSDTMMHSSQGSVRWISCDFFPPLWRETKWMRFDLNDKRVRIKQNQQTPLKNPLNFVFITSNPTEPSQVKSRSTCSPFSVNRINSKLYMRSKLLPNPLKNTLTCRSGGRQQ